MKKRNLRRHHRYPILATAHVSPREGGDVQPIETMVASISQSGLGVYSYSPLKTGTRVRIEITFISVKGVKEKDTTEGRVVWLSGMGRLYFIGIAFDEELSPAKQPRLYEHFFKVVSWD
ncbi:MAG TPA: PilZ domain-containing protein [Nitrospirae bacterium]|nr:PilZ domain-containing protein [Nitrospirota bacterium]